MRVNIGASTTLFCNVTRTYPEITDYTWMKEDTNTVLNENTNTLQLISLTEQDFGTISCTATNAAGIFGKANVTVEQGCKLSYDLNLSGKEISPVSIQFLQRLLLLIPIQSFLMNLFS